VKIEPKYVTFEQAKWVKENRFIEPTLTYWSKRDGLIENEITLRNHNERGEWSTSRPEQWQVVEWLRVNHGIWISVNWYNKNNNNIFWSYTIEKIVKYPEPIDYTPQNTINSNTPQEAYSSAFDYIKDNNLI